MCCDKKLLDIKLFKSPLEPVPNAFGEGPNFSLSEIRGMFNTAWCDLTMGK